MKFNVKKCHVFELYFSLSWHENLERGNKQLFCQNLSIVKLLDENLVNKVQPTLIEKFFSAFCRFLHYQDFKVTNKNGFFQLNSPLQPSIFPLTLDAKTELVGLVTHEFVNVGL